MIELKLLSALDKVFIDAAPLERPENPPLTGFQNETLSFQAAYSLVEGAPNDYVELSVASPLRERIRVRRVEHVPVRFTTFPDADANYLRRAPGLYPDRLTDCTGRLRLYRGQWDSLWFDVEPDASVAPGRYPIELTIANRAGDTLAARTQWVEILPGLLPPQTLIHTKWFHADCLAEYYDVPVFSDAHFQIIERFIRAAVRRGINMILTPIHTPPLDTRVGGERPTVQLVDVTLRHGEYAFGFEKLRRWVDICKRCGVEYYEMAHLFTQWGATCTPKIVADVDGEVKRIFGWDVPAESDSYRAFLDAYLPALVAELKALGIAPKCYFHISDEPGAAHLESYRAAKAMTEKHLQGFMIIDALSDFAFYQSGAVAHPVPAINHIEPFLEGGVEGLWTYYCIGQYKDVSNMFVAMPSSRNRILGVQLYKFGIVGFLQWGYNFYHCQYSDFLVNPYAVTDAEAFTPAGDAFQVYPGRGGVPEESIRMMVTFHALEDMRAFALLESLKGRAYVLDLIDESLAEPVTFTRYPKSDDYLLRLRHRVNAAIVAARAE